MGTFLVLAAYFSQIVEKLFQFLKEWFFFYILLGSLNEHDKNWSEILEWISICGDSESVVALRLFEVKLQVQNGSSYLLLCGSLRTCHWQRETSSMQRRIALWVVFLWWRKKHLVKRKGFLGTRIRSWPLIMTLPLRARSPFRSWGLWYDCAVHGWGGDCQRNFLCKI